MNYIAKVIAFILLIVVIQQLSLFRNKTYKNEIVDTNTGQTDKQSDFIKICFLIWMLFMIIVIVTVL